MARLHVAPPGSALRDARSSDEMGIAVVSWGQGSRVLASRISACWSGRMGSSCPSTYSSCFMEWVAIQWGGPGFRTVSFRP